MGVNLLGAVTEYGDTTVLECGGSFTGGVTIRFLEHLQAEFGEKLIVLLDQATYFTVEAMKNFAAEGPIGLVYSPTGSPDLNPTEEYWKRLKQTLGTATSEHSARFAQQSGRHSQQLIHRECINISVSKYKTDYPRSSLSHQQCTSQERSAVCQRTRSRSHRSTRFSRDILRSSVGSRDCRATGSERGNRSVEPLILNIMTL